MDHIDREPIEGNRDSLSLWAIYLPSDQDRDKYIQNCFFTNTVTVINRNGEVKHRTPIPVSLLKEISFPLDANDIGSQVLCANLPYQNKILVLQVYQDTSSYSTGKEHISTIRKTFQGKSVEIVFDTETGSLDLNVDSDSDGGELNINVSNNTRSGQLNINVNGRVTMQVDGTIDVQSSQTTKMSGKTIEINGNEEPMLLGNKTIELVSDLLDQLSKETAGPYNLVGSAAYTQLKNKLDSLKSKITFVG